MEKYIVKIKDISWVDKESSEAEILFDINGKQFWAFCHPCNFIENEISEVYFNFIEDNISEFAFWNENTEQKKDIISSQNDKLRYYCYGSLESIHPTIIDCGIMNFNLEEYINDERAIGTYVYFVISRLDIEKYL